MPTPTVEIKVGTFLASNVVDQLVRHLKDSEELSEEAKISLYASAVALAAGMADMYEHTGFDPDGVKNGMVIVARPTQVSSGAWDLEGLLEDPEHLTLPEHLGDVSNLWLAVNGCMERGETAEACYAAMCILGREGIERWRNQLKESVSLKTLPVLVVLTDCVPDEDEEGMVKSGGIITVLPMLRKYLGKSTEEKEPIDRVVVSPGSHAIH